MNRRLQLQKRSNCLFGVHHETLAIAMRVGNPDRLPVGIQSLRYYPNSNRL